MKTNSLSLWERVGERVYEKPLFPHPSPLPKREGEEFSTAPAKTPVAFVPGSADADRKTCRHCEGKAFPAASARVFFRRPRRGRRRSFVAEITARPLVDREPT